MMLINALKIIPKNLVSYLAGSLMRARLPAILFRSLAQAFIKAFGIDMSEASQDVGQYRTLEDIFTRNLKPGSRKFHFALCSPADGVLVCSRSATRAQAIQCKGLNYDLNQLVMGARANGGEEGLTWYSTIYLAPHNYHRVHSPCSGQLKRIRYIPGELWPVNKMAVRYVPKLFIRNERLVFDISLNNGGNIYVVMVGALNVGRITTPFWPGFCSNSLTRQLMLSGQQMEHKTDVKLETGDELGVFMLGSTVVLVFDHQAQMAFQIMQNEQDRVIMVGDSLLEI